MISSLRELELVWRSAAGRSFFDESTQEAVRALLRSRSGYADEPDAGVGGLASFKQGNVSLPAS